LLRYLSEIRFQVLTAIYPRFTHESGTIRKKQAIDVPKLKCLLCYESQHQRQSNEKSLVQFDYEKAVSNYLGTQSTFKVGVSPISQATALPSASGSTHTESCKLYRKVKHRAHPKVRLQPTAKARPDQAAIATSAAARGTTHG